MSAIGLDEVQWRRGHKYLTVVYPIDEHCKRLTFRLHAAHGLCWNSPFLDPEITETAFQIPDHLKIRGLRQKYILRRACEGLVPERILRRKKSLQRLRHDEGLSDVLEHLAAELLSPPAVAARGILAPTEVNQVRWRPVGRIYPKEQAYSLWALLVTEIWARLYLDQRGRSPRIEGFQRDTGGLGDTPARTLLEMEVRIAALTLSNV